MQSAVLQHTYRRWRRLADQSHLFSLPSESNRVRLFLDVYKIVQVYNTPEIGNPDSNWWDVGSTAFVFPIFAYLHRSSSCLEFSLELLLTSFAQDGHRTLQLSILPGFQKHLGEARAKSHELLPCRLPSSKHFGSIVPYRHRINPCDSCLQMTNVSKTHSNIVTCWHRLAERLCTNTASMTLSPKPVSIIDLSDLEPESTVLARAKGHQEDLGTTCVLRQTDIHHSSCSPIPSWNLTLVRVLALAVSHAVQKPLTLWRTCTPAGNKLVCSVSYILHPCWNTSFFQSSSWVNVEAVGVLYILAYFVYIHTC